MNAVFFDLDGTLMDTPGIIVKCMREMLGPSNRNISKSVLRGHIGRPLDSIIADLAPDANPDSAETMKLTFRSSFRAATAPDARHLVFPELHELISTLKSNGTKCAVVTSKITASAIELLTAGGILHYFDAVIGHDQAETGKPSPDLALMASSTLNIEIENCTVVGDSPDDIGMGLSAGAKTIGVTWGISEIESLCQSGAHWVAETTEQLASLLLDHDRWKYAEPCS